ncbi:MAG: hypothetical protein JO047_03115 [Alphaproteobacteria bacterium]|nr:hypothetical protein [Alphaproteobacteria bacterium]
MSGTGTTDVPYDRTVEDLGNIVELGHVNVRVPDQKLATLFYISGLGLTRDPYLMTGVTNMWANAGRSQFHLPTGRAQVLRGHTALVLPDREALLQRLAAVRRGLEDTSFDFREHDDYVEAVCPWGNRIRCYEPEPRFGRITLGMPYVEIDVRRGTASRIADFYEEILDAFADVEEDEQSRCARVMVGPDQYLIYRETDRPIEPHDGAHIQITLVDFSGPHERLLAKGLVTEESDQHQYRFEDVLDLETGKALVTVEHEVRSMRHPLYGRPLVNRNPAQTNQRFAAGHESWAWAMPYSD